jgi:hypothetical protein
MARYGLRLAAALGLVFLPFWLLVRGCLWLGVHQGWPVWMALAGSAAASTLALLLYSSWLARKVASTVASKVALEIDGKSDAKSAGRLSPGSRFVQLAAGLAVAVVVLFTGHALFFLSDVHAKSAREEVEYRELHPALRLAVGSYRLVDDRVLITDIARESRDYVRMGLPVLPHSLHMSQRDGYVHAIDLRTIDRGVIHNALLRIYFEGMGFETLRHFGNADHLHVELPRAVAG